ncbi:hypothetical protein HYFRA_00010864 [Hymenoscyphus fraxineus]|uniref:PQ loop repeat protein n=1 Tax=Hymenoscyphus fraxineus TaxID=746836 RepID=A0A9N9PSX7_9HELO|nr:hypothetical protein HYFRA_00010864 [Hymenoscyphus fraxineus]
MDVPIAANVLGTIGALIPQIIINYRRHNTIGLQRSMMLLWAIAGVPLGAYNISEGFNIALRIQPQILTVLSLITWGQCFYYDDKWSSWKCTALLSITGLIFGGIEAGLVFALKAGTDQGRHWPVIFVGVLSTVLLSAGVLRHYYDIYIHRTVRGISFIFVAIDAAGDVFSLISVFFQPKLDILGMVIYATEFVLWCGVFACGGYFNLLPWVKQRLSNRSQMQQDSELQSAGDQVSAAPQDMSLHEIGSSTSVFRTPSSVASSRLSARPAA